MYCIESPCVIEFVITFFRCFRVVMVNAVWDMLRDLFAPPSALPVRVELMGPRSALASLSVPRTPYALCAGCVPLLRRRRL